MNQYPLGSTSVYKDSTEAHGDPKYLKLNGQIRAVNHLYLLLN